MKKERIVSLDYGTQRIGVAISDETQTIARGLGLVLAAQKEQETIQRILKLLEPYKIEKILVGNPLYLNGKISPMAQAAQRFSAQLAALSGYPVILYEERLSSLQAERLLKEGGLSRRKRTPLVDTLAAVIILQAYLGIV